MTKKAAKTKTAKAAELFRLLRTSFVWSLLIFLLALLCVYWLAGWRIAEPIIYGYVYSLFTITFGFVSIYWAFAKSTNLFMAVTLGGMFIRFILLGTVLYLVRRFTGLHFTSFLISLLGFYFLLQFFEIWLLHRELVGGK